MGIVFVLALILGGMRVAGVTHIAFQAVAHLFVGGLFGGWLVSLLGRSEERPTKWWLFWLFLAMTVLETACFLLMPSALRTQLLGH